jgi:hypothetical protein
MLHPRRVHRRWRRPVIPPHLRPLQEQGLPQPEDLNLLNHLLKRTLHPTSRRLSLPHNHLPKTNPHQKCRRRSPLHTRGPRHPVDPNRPISNLRRVVYHPENRVRGPRNHHHRILRLLQTPLHNRLLVAARGSSEVLNRGRLHRPVLKVCLLPLFQAHLLFVRLNRKYHRLQISV